MGDCLGVIKNPEVAKKPSRLLPENFTSVRGGCQAVGKAVAGKKTSGFNKNFILACLIIIAKVYLFFNILSSIAFEVRCSVASPVASWGAIKAMVTDHEKRTLCNRDFCTVVGDYNAHGFSGGTD